MVDFLFVIIELFHYFLRLRRYKWKSVEVDVFRRGWATLSANIRRKGASIARQPLLVPEKQSDCPFVWYQNIMWRTGGRTDRITTANTALA